MFSKSLINNTFCLLFLVCFCGHHFLTAQISDEQLIWKAQLNKEDKDDYKTNFRKIIKGGYRIDQKALDSSRLIIEFTDIKTLTQTLPGKKDFLEFVYSDQSNQSRAIQLSRTKINEQLNEGFESKIIGKMMSARFRGTPEDYIEKKQKDFQLILKSKKSSTLWKNSIWKIDFGDLEQPDFNKDYSLKFVCGKVDYAELRFDTLGSNNFVPLVNFNQDPCQPVDRSTYFRKHVASNYEGLNYRSYRPRSGVKRKKHFKVYFDQGKSDYSMADIQPIVEYLNDSNLVIRSAKIQAYASVEGDSAINMRLQRERAEVLLKTLVLANRDSIEAEINTYEDWEGFDEQLSESQYAEMYEHTEWKELLESDSVARYFEPLLKKQRRAELDLELTKRLTPLQKVEIALRDFNNLSNRYQWQASIEIKMRQVRRLFAIKRFLEKEVLKENADPAWVCDLFPFENYEFRIIQFYETSLQVQKGKELVCDNLKDVVLSAHFAARDLLEEKPENRLYLRQLLDIQTFAYLAIQKDLLDPSILCQLDYPDAPPFYNALLNFYHFLDYSGRIYSDLPCLSAFNNMNQSRNNQYASLNAEYLPGNIVDSRYYFFLKKVVLNDDQNMLKLVERSDNILQFDLVEFLMLNIHGWKVWDEKLFDKEVTPEIIAVQLKRLNSMVSNLCGNQINKLNLTFHQNMLHYAFLNNKKTELTDESLDYIRSYYIRNMQELDQDQLTSIVSQLLAVSSLYYKNEPAKKAYELMERKHNQEPLTGRALRYYANLIRLVELSSGKSMRLLKDIQNTEEGARLEFGRYNVDM